MVRLLLGQQATLALAPDATDALALALCCAQRLRLDRLRDAAAAPRDRRGSNGSQVR
jgi:Holliday junction resolvasome RuvABC endonuclease subunit